MHGSSNFSAMFSGKGYADTSWLHLIRSVGIFQNRRWTVTQNIYNKHEGEKTWRIFKGQSETGFGN